MFPLFGGWLFIYLFILNELHNWLIIFFLLLLFLMCNDTLPLTARTLFTEHTEFFLLHLKWDPNSVCDCPAYSAQFSYHIRWWLTCGTNPGGRILLILYAHRRRPWEPGHLWVSLRNCCKASWFQLSVALRKHSSWSSLERKAGVPLKSGMISLWRFWK